MKHVSDKIASSHAHLLSQFACRRKDQRLAFLQSYIQLLQNGDGKRGRLASTRLSLCDHVVPLDAGDDRALLDCRRLLETVGVYATQQVLFEAHVVKVVHHLIPVALQRSKVNKHNQ